MSPLDRELCATLGELVLVRRANEKVAADKEALFKWLGTGADIASGKLFRRIWPATKAVGRFGRAAIKKPWNVAMEAGGIRGLTKEQELLTLLRRSGNKRPWATVKAFAEAKGMKSPVGAFSTIFDPMRTLSPRFSEAGQARWLLGMLKDPAKLRQFLIGATPAQRAAIKKLTPMFDKAQQAGEVGAVAKWGVPAALIGGPLAYGAMASGNDGKRPVTSAVESGFKSQDAPSGPNMLERFWSGAGDQISKLSPAIGGAISAHPYLSTAAAGGLGAAGLYGLFGGSKERQP
jgi:hypothetical protein